MKAEKTEKTIIKFRDIEIQKQKFYQPISIKNLMKLNIYLFK